MNKLDRTKPPEIINEIKFSLPEIENFDLSNGLNVYFVKKEKLPITQILMLTSAGSKYDDNKLNGLSHLTAALIDEGAGEFDALQLNNEIEKLGSIIKISSDKDFIYTSLLSLTDNIERSLYLFSKILIEPKLEPADFEREKKKKISKIIQLKDEPSYLADTVFEKILFNNSYYQLPVLGTETSAANIKLDDVQLFYQEYFSPTNSTLIVVSNLNSNTIVDLLEKYFSCWKKEIKNNCDPLQLNTKTKKAYLVHKDDLVQSEIRIGNLIYQKNNTEYLRQQILNTVLGGQFSSRLNLNLREKRGFTYGVSSAFNYMQSAANFEVSTAVKSENTAEAVAEILNELEKIREKITEEEVNFAKSYLIKRFPSRFETYSNISSNISVIITLNLDKNFLNDYLHNIKQLTTKEIITSARETIFPEESIIVVVGNRKVVKEQLLKIFNENLLEIEYNDVFFHNSDETS
ncbi:M16 family metallopeptidase [Melioribacteraceae bacterium 4301-Me]|uniref:M16 family metallopeptidase n=1 Tax=Pyranulibacter aquaticus TaxID=3163344 RepID=UPI003595C24C